MKLTFTSLDAAGNCRAFAEGMSGAARTIADQLLKRADEIAALTALIEAGEATSAEPVVLTVPDTLGNMVAAVLNECLDTKPPVVRSARLHGQGAKEWTVD